MENLSQDPPGVSPMIVVWGDNATDSLEGSIQDLYAGSPCHGAGAGQQLLNYNRTEINPRSIFIVKLMDEWECGAAMNQIDV
jgi:hypothetical protein